MSDPILDDLAQGDAQHTGEVRIQILRSSSGGRRYTKGISVCKTYIVCVNKGRTQYTKA